jgi:hypothetical protein
MSGEPSEQGLGRVPVLGRLRPELGECSTPGDDRREIGDRGSTQPIGGGLLFGSVLIAQLR